MGFNKISKNILDHLMVSNTKETFIKQKRGCLKPSLFTNRPGYYVYRDTHGFSRKF